MSKITKRYLFYGLTLCLFALAFALLYYFKVIKNLNLLLTVVYVAYFAGLGLIVNCVYCKKRHHTVSAVLNGVLGAIFLIGSVVLLIIGLTNGQIQM